MAENNAKNITNSSKLEITLPNVSMDTIRKALDELCDNQRNFIGYRVLIPGKRVDGKLVPKDALYAEVLAMMQDAGVHCHLSEFVPEFKDEDGKITIKAIKETPIDECEPFPPINPSFTSLFPRRRGIF